MTKKVYFQIGFWTIILVINLALAQGGGRPAESFIFETISIVLYAFVFYFNILWLFPKYYDKHKAGYMAGSFLLLLGVFVLLHTLGGEIFGHNDDRNYRQFFDHDDKLHHKPFFELIAMFRQAFWLVLIYMMATVYSIQQKLNQQINHTRMVHEEKLKTELQLLKAQIDPHFLFNALNNVYSLTYMKSEKAPESILKLSEMLRYVLEDCSSDRVPLKNEITYVENLIDFYKMKSPGKRKITFTSEIGNMEIGIAPMLFIPFIENSFKYSRIEEDKNGFIVISLKETSGKLQFTIENSIFLARPILNGSRKGIANVRQRLEIIYPNKYTLHVIEEETKYVVELDIDLT